jgi:hypothetical protein
MDQIGLHSEPDARIKLMGDAHYENGRLIVGDADLAEKFAAALGILEGGRQMVYVVCVATKISTEVITSSQTFGGKFAENGERPVAPQGLG